MKLLDIKNTAPHQLELTFSATAAACYSEHIILGRESPLEELAFLNEPGSGF